VDCELTFLHHFEGNDKWLVQVRYVVGEDNYKLVVRDGFAKVSDLVGKFADAVRPRTHRLRTLLLCTEQSAA
jgi:hypothetical protein